MNTVITKKAFAFVAVLFTLILFHSKALAQPPFAQFAASDSVGCGAPFAVHFFNQTIGAADSWSWDFGDGFTSNVENPVHSFSSVGEFFVTLTATSDENGSTSTSVFSVGGGYVSSIKIDALPTVSISGGGSFCYGGSANIVFNGTPNGVVQCLFDGTPLSGLVLNSSGSAVLTNTFGGTYSLVGISDVLGCTSLESGTANVDVTYPPTINQVTGTTTICNGSTTQLTPDVTGSTSDFWTSTDNGTASVDGSGLVTGNFEGGATITYHASNGCGTSTADVPVTVLQSPGVISGVTSLCQGTTGEVVVGVAGGTWHSFETNIITIAAEPTGISATVTPHNAGTAEIAYTLPDGCPTSSIITVFPTPVPTVTPAGPVTFCTGGSTVLNANVVSGYTYQWYNGTSLLVGENNASYTATTSGAYNVLETEPLGICSAYSSNTAVTVNPTYATGFTAAICQGQDYTFGGSTYTTAGNHMHTFSSIAGCDSVVTLTLNVNPTYNDTVSAVICQGQNYVFGDSILTTAGNHTQPFSTITGCDSVVTLTLIVNPSYNSTENATICQGQTYTFFGDDFSTTGNYPHVLSTVAGCDSVITLALTVTPSYSNTDAAAICAGQSYYFGGDILTTAGSYTHTFSTVTGCDSIVTLTLSIAPAPTVAISETENGCAGQSTLTANGGTSYSWAPATGLSCTNCASTTVTGSSVLVYTVTATNANGCTDTGSIAINSNRIAGYITFNGPAPDTLDTKVWLLNLVVADSALVVVDSTVTCLVSGVPYYRFDNEAAGIYTVRAQLLSGNNPGGNGYVPTFAVHSQYWDNSVYTNHAAGTDSLNVEMQYGIVPTGPGFITGDITSGVNKNTNDGVPVVGMMVYLRNQVTGQVLTYTYTDVDGNYAFNGIAYGTYGIFPEFTNYTTTPRLEIVLTAGSDSAVNVNFKQHTMARTITPNYAAQGIAGITTNSGLNIYPNPSTGLLNITWKGIVSQDAEVIITDLAGREMFTANMSMAVSGSKQLNVSILKDGIYSVTVKGKMLNYNSKLVIMK